MNFRQTGPQIRGCINLGSFKITYLYLFKKKLRYIKCNVQLVGHFENFIFEFEILYYLVQSICTGQLS